MGPISRTCGLWRAIIGALVLWAIPGSAFAQNPIVVSKIYMGTATITPSGTTIVFSGNVQATGFVGPLTGNVTGNVSGSAASITGSLTGDVTSAGMATSIAAGVIVDADVAASAAIAWSKLSKSGSSLADLGTRSAADLSSGTLADARLSSNVVLKNGTNAFTGTTTFLDSFGLVSSGGYGTCTHRVGSGVPSSGLGADCDTYSDVTNDHLYVKVSGNWRNVSDASADTVGITDKSDQVGPYAVALLSDYAVSPVAIYTDNGSLRYSPALDTLSAGRFSGGVRVASTADPATSNIWFLANLNAARYIGIDEPTVGSFTGTLVTQAGESAANAGGAINLFGASHATRPGWVVAGISSGSGGKFAVNSSALGGGTDVFTVDASGNTTVAGAATVTGATTLAGLSATTGVFSSTLSVTGGTTLSSYLSLSSASPALYIYDSDGTANKRMASWQYDGDKLELYARADNEAWVRTLLSINHDGAVTVPGPLGVTGAATFGSTVGVTGATTLSTLTVERGGAASTTAYETVATLTAHESSESATKADTGAASYGITFRRNYNGGNYSNLAGIYAYGANGWRGGLAFRTKDDSSQAGSPVTTMVLQPDGLLVLSGGANIGGTITAASLGSDTGTDLVLNGSNLIKVKSSSELYKEHIERGYVADVSAFLSLQPIRFDYIAGERGVIGFSAEEALAAVGPQLVNWKDGLPTSLRSETWMAYQHLALRDHDARIARLEAALAAK